MLYRLFIILVMLVLASTAQAGPWLREKGTTFISVSVATNYFLDTASQTYVEYGLTEKTTVVGDLSTVRPRYALEQGYVTLSFRRALTKPDAKSKLAYEMGIGVGWIGAETLPIVRTGLSWGRGIEWGGKSGWTTIEASRIWDLTYAQHEAKLDMTLGMNFTEVTTGMIQVYTAEILGKTYATIAPSLIFKPKNRKFKFQIGAETPVGNVYDSALKLGLWREF